jgi:hypothetical protein
MSDGHPMPSDPWETPPVEIDPDLRAVSEQLMAKSQPKPAPESDTASPTPAEGDPRILQLEQEKQRFFERNVQLTLEVARLRVANQQLLDQVTALQSAAPPDQGWFVRLLQRFRNPKV